MINEREDVYFNKVYILQSLDDGERRTGDEIQSKIRNISLKDHSIDVELIDLKSTNDFFKTIQAIKSTIPNGTLPFIHFEIHGSKDGLVLTSGDFISWSNLKEPLRDTNILTKNNLFISLATCFGAHLLNIYKPWEPCPFYGYIGPLASAGNRDLEDSYSVFFEVLLLENNFAKAISALLDTVPSNSNNYAYLNCFGYFKMLTDLYKEQNNNPRIWNARVKEIVNKHKERHPQNKLSNNELRKQVERLLLTGKEDEEFERMAEVFFHKRKEYL